MKKEETIQNYLEAIYFISKDKKQVRAIDIVNYLQYSRPTVSIALKELEKENYILIDSNNISLTETGKKVAKSMSERHTTIAQILMHLGVSKENAYRDACLIEHDLSNESFEAIKKIAKTLK